MANNVAIVTGANKGIGLATVKSLAKKFPGTVYLTSRNEERGIAAAKSLKNDFQNVKFHSLDISNSESIKKFAQYIKQNYNGIDILVNNAAIAFEFASPKPFIIQATETLNTNYFGVKNTCDYLFPMLNPGARVINVSSSAGHLSRIPGKELQKRFSDPNLSYEDLDILMEDYIKSVQDDTFEEKGWPLRSYLTKAGLSSTYSVSKVGVSALTRIQQQIMDTSNRDLDIVINCVHPGFVNTDMSSHRGHFTPEEGAKPIIYAAKLPEKSMIRGKFIWYDCTIVDWEAKYCSK